MILREQVFRSRDGELSETLDTLRGLACLLVVAWHVVGWSETSGLRLPFIPANQLWTALQGPDAFLAMLRTVSDLLADFRMPAFAFVGGCVYALRPVRGGDYRAFVLGKFRRIVLPGLAAIYATALLTLKTADPLAADIFKPELIYMPYQHYWYLMAIMVILLTYAALDIATRGAAAVPLLAVATLVYLMVDPPSDVFAVNRATDLVPFFALGVVCIRKLDWIGERRFLIIAAAVAATLIGAALKIDAYRSGLYPSLEGGGVARLAFGGGLCALLLAARLRIAPLIAIAPTAFIIYLYHMFFIKAASGALETFGVSDAGLRLVFGVACGIIGPTVAIAVAERVSPTISELFLGTRRAG